MSAASAHQEIEHKFIVGADFDRAGFDERAHALKPERTTALRVQDTYFVSALLPQLIFRHRFDHERQELTVKSRGAHDPEVRMEVNLRLAQDAGSQLDAVVAFLRPFAITWQGSLTKDIQVYYYPDCEVVYYDARTATRRVCCVEFEAVGCASLDAARTVLAAYEQRLGLGAAEREQKTLFDLLLLPEMTAQLARG